MRLTGGVGPTGIVRLYWWRVRTHAGQEALAAAGIAVGIALIFAVEIAGTSIPASVRALEHGIAGRASLEVAARGPEGFDQSLVARVAEAPGVFGAAGILEAHVTLVGPKGRLPLTLFGAEAGIGAIGGPLARKLSLRALEAGAQRSRRGLAGPRRARAGPRLETLALPEAPARQLGAVAGGRLVVDVGGRAVAVRCGRVLGARALGPAAASPIAIALLPVAQRITGLEQRVTRVLVLPRRGRGAAVRRVLGARFGRALGVRSSASEVSLLSEAMRASNEAATLFTALSVLVGLLFAYNAMLLTLPARRHHLVRLRSMGARRSELGGLLALEVLTPWLVAALAGLALGDLLAATSFGAPPRYVASGFPIGAQRTITAAALALALGGGMLAALVAALGPALGPLRGRALERPSEDAAGAASLGGLSGAASLAVAAAAIAATVALALLSPGSGLVTVIVLALAVLLLVPALLPWWVGRGFALAARLRSVTAYIAASELRAAPVRAGAVAATGAVALYAIVAIGGALGDVRRAATRTSAEMFGSSGAIVSADSFASVPFQAQPFDPGPVARRLRGVTVVARVDPLRTAFLDVRRRRLFVMAKPSEDPVPVPAAQIVDGRASTVARLLRQGGWAVLSAPVAAEWGLRLGEPFTLPTPSGNARLRLAATISNYGWPPGTVMVGPAEYDRLWRSNAATLLFVRFKRGVAEAAGARALRPALRGTGLIASTRQTAARGIVAATNQGLGELGDISTLLLVAAVLAVVGAMAGSVWQRAPRLAYLTRLGAYRGELVRAIYLETALVALTGCLIGALFGLGAQPLATRYIHYNAGFPEVYSPAFALAAEMTLLASALATVATALMGYLLTRRRWRRA